MITLPLNGKWRLHEEPLSCKGLAGLRKATEDKTGWITATVPGEVHLDLMRAGRMEEPLVSLNAKKSRWPEKRSWWYEKTFTVTADFLQQERQQLTFDGLDLYAQIFLNGELLGETNNAFIPHTFDVRHRLCKGKNTLVVRLTVGYEMLDKSLKAERPPRRLYGFPGRPHLRKPQFTYGWDWVDILPNIGIWRGVRLEGFSGVILRDVQVHTSIHKEKARLNISALADNLHPWSDRECTVVITVTPPTGHVISEQITFCAQTGRSPFSHTIEIPNPQLWWPNGMGEQALYTVTIQSFSEEFEFRHEMEIGLRTIELDRSPIAAGGSRFCLRVNGQDVFCKGANCIPPDAILARITPAKYEALIAEAQKANMNMLRVWGGGIYPPHEFFSACDRAGILVWQDFMFSCAEYPDHKPEFRAMVRHEAEVIVKQFRHHPSIALWCGDNEDVWAFGEWWIGDKKVGDKDLKIGGTQIFNDILPEVCYTFDRERPYWPSSPCGGEKPNSQLEGDCHWWGSCTLSEDMERRINHEIYDECRSRFLSEYGIIGPCHLDSMKEYLKPDELYVGSAAWNEHTNTFERETLAAAIKRHYAEPDGLSIQNYILYGQMFQATMYGRSIEAMRFRKHDRRDDCQGVLIWMYNDCWGETGWTPIDYYLRRKASYYWIRNANAPIKAIVRRRDNKLITRVVNDPLEPRKCNVHYGWMRLDGKDCRDIKDGKMKQKSVSVPANGMIEIDGEKIPAKLSPRDWFYAAWLSGDGIEQNPCVWLLAPYRELNVPKGDIQVTVKGQEITLVSATYCHGVHIDDGGGNVLSDNYFDLLPGIPKCITCNAPAIPRNLKFTAV